MLSYLDNRFLLLTQELQNWCKELRLPITVNLGEYTSTVLIDDDDDYECAVIEIGEDIRDEERGIAFSQFLYEYGLKYEVDYRAMAFLHEIGHFMTVCLFNETERASYYRLVWQLCDKEESNKEITLKYWLTDMEFAATAWAINFANDNYDMALWLESIFRKYLSEEP